MAGLALAWAWRNRFSKTEVGPADGASPDGALFDGARVDGTLLDAAAPDAARDTVSPEVISPEQARDLCRVLLLIQVVTFFSAQADIWIAGFEFSGDDLALYNVSRRTALIVAIPMQMANFLVAGLIAPLAARGRRRELQFMLRVVATLFALPSLAALGVIVFLGGPLLALLFGEFYRAAAPLLVVIGVGQAILILAGSCHTALTMARQQAKALAVNFVAAIAIALGGFLAAHHFGVVGLAVVYSLVVAAESFALLLLAKRYLGVWTHIDLLATAVTLARLAMAGPPISGDPPESSAGD